mmetsp:Transcript_37293/g.79181  ORF Transcript_37293/g.79181 Transcript_37293/m.79181 type:complete len:210 (+) Transcript_37293:290-919(+)
MSCFCHSQEVYACVQLKDDPHFRIDCPRENDYHDAHDCHVQHRELPEQMRHLQAPIGPRRGKLHHSRNHDQSDHVHNGEENRKYPQHRESNEGVDLDWSVFRKGPVPQLPDARPQAHIVFGHLCDTQTFDDVEHLGSELPSFNHLIEVQRQTHGWFSHADNQAHCEEDKAYDAERQSENWAWKAVHASLIGLQRRSNSQRRDSGEDAES